MLPQDSRKGSDGVNRVIALSSADSSVVCVGVITSNLAAGRFENNPSDEGTEAGRILLRLCSAERISPSPVECHMSMLAIAFAGTREEGERPAHNPLCDSSDQQSCWLLIVGTKGSLSEFDRGGSA